MRWSLCLPAAGSQLQSGSCTSLSWRKALSASLQSMTWRCAVFLSWPRKHLFGAEIVCKLIRGCWMHGLLLLPCCLEG